MPVWDPISGQYVDPAMGSLSTEVMAALAPPPQPIQLSPQVAAAEQANFAAMTAPPPAPPPTENVMDFVRNSTPPPQVSTPAPVAPVAAPVAPTIPQGPSDYGFMSSVKREQAAIQDLAKVQSAQAMSVAKLEEGKLKADQQLEQQRMDILKKQGAQRKIDLKHYEELNTKVGEPIDAKRFWKNKNGFEKAGAALAVMMGAFGDALMQVGGIKGPGNQALAIVENAIEQDIQIQKENAALNRDKAQSAFNLYRINMDHYGNDLDALNATRANMWNQYAMRAAAVGATAQSKEAQARAAAAAEASQQKAATFQMEVDKNRADAMAKLGTLSKGASERVIQIAPGYQVQAVSESAAKDLRGAQAMYSTIIPKVDELIEMRKKYGSEHGGGPVQARMETIHSGLLTEMKTLFGLGVLSEGDMKLLTGFLPPPGQFGFVLPKLQEAKRYISDKTDSMFKANSAPGTYKGLPEQNKLFRPAN